MYVCMCINEYLFIYLFIYIFINFSIAKYYYLDSPSSKKSKGSFPVFKKPQ